MLSPEDVRKGNLPGCGHSTECFITFAIYILPCQVQQMSNKNKSANPLFQKICVVLQIFFKSPYTVLARYTIRSMERVISTSTAMMRRLDLLSE